MRAATVHERPSQEKFGIPLSLQGSQDPYSSLDDPDNNQFLRLCPRRLREQRPGASRPSIPGDNCKCGRADDRESESLDFVTLPDNVRSSLLCAVTKNGNSQSQYPTGPSRGGPLSRRTLDAKNASTSVGPRTSPIKFCDPQTLLLVAGLFLYVRDEALDWKARGWGSGTSHRRVAACRSSDVCTAGA